MGSDISWAQVCFGGDEKIPNLDYGDVYIAL